MLHFARCTIGLVVTLALIGPARAAEVDRLLKVMQAVGPEGDGNGAAAAAWKELSQAEATQLPAILAGLDDANPLAANWIGSAASAVADRAIEKSQPLPLAELERFLLDRRHTARARRLAYEWIVHGSPAKSQPLLAKMLDDPSLELRRDAVALRMGEGDALRRAKQTDKAAAVFRQTLSTANDLDQVRQLADRLKQLGQPVDLQRHFGFLVHWKLIGPFDNTDGKGFATVSPPEREIELAASYPGKHGSLKWTDHVSKDDLGKVDFNKVFAEEKATVGYAFGEFWTANGRDVQLRLNTANAAKLWLNGKLMHEHNYYHNHVAFDRYILPCRLEPGRNVILLKICQNEQHEEWTRAWDFQLRVCNKIGEAVLPDR